LVSFALSFGILKKSSGTGNRLSLAVVGVPPLEDTADTPVWNDVDDMCDAIAGSLARLCAVDAMRIRSVSAVYIYNIKSPS
jgi:hypothetical protein